SAGGNSTAVAAESADRVQAAACATGVEASTGNTANIGQAIALKPASSDVTIDPEYQIVGATGTYSATGTLSPSRSWATSIATFRAACQLPSRCRSRSEEHTSELQSLAYLVCRLLLEKKKKQIVLWCE